RPSGHRGRRVGDQDEPSAGGQSVDRLTRVVVTATSFWRVVEPARWPAAPERLSHSTVLDIETCARRWALAHADYTDTLGLTRYPSRFRRRTMAGQVTHLALQRIADCLREAGCV